MQQVEPVLHHRFVHADGKGEVVRRILEKRVPPYIHFVEEHVRQKLRKTERLPISDEMDLVTSRGERDSELGRDSAGSSIRRVTCNADLQEVSFHHR
jgi:hypothetical protein